MQVLSRSNTSASNSVESNKQQSSSSYSHQHDNDSYRNAARGGGGGGGNRYSTERDRRNDRRPRSRDTDVCITQIIFIFTALADLSSFLFSYQEENDRKRRRGGGGGGDDRSERPPRQRESMEYGRDRTKSPLRRASPPKRRRAHNIPRYMVQIPKVSLSLANIDVMEVKKRYPNLYIPSDFTQSENAWMSAFPFNKPFSMQKPCSFHIMKDVSPIDETVAQCVLDPPDADYSWSAKVMLLSRE